MKQTYEYPKIYQNSDKAIAQQGRGGGKIKIIKQCVSMFTIF